MTDLRELLRPRVERGAALLDSVEPYWWKRVEERPSLADCKRCVLGQVYGDYEHGLNQLDVAAGDLAGWEWASARGFTYGPDCQGRRRDTWATLDDLWLEAIEARRQS